VTAYEVLGSEPAGDGWVLAVHIPAASPLFAGHFPGHPILPGVAHLALVTRALTDWRGRETALAAVRSLKLRRPVGPGETVEVRLAAPGEDGSVGFSLTHDGLALSRGTVIPGEPGGAGAWR
jgi:3-hydroxyacyl-[acyl-carrier-protein] dehydratase